MEARENGFERRLRELDVEGSLLMVMMIMMMMIMMIMIMMIMTTEQRIVAAATQNRRD